MREPKVKGLMFAHFQQFIISNHGEEGLSRVLGQISPSANKTLSTWNALEWYPIAHMIEVDLAVVNSFYDGNLNEIYRVGKFNLERSVRQVYRFLFQFLEPWFLVKRVSKMWNHYYDCGRLEVEPIDDCHAVIRIFDFNPVHRSRCISLGGAFVGGLEVCHASNVKVVHSECVLQGGKACVHEVSWQNGGTDHAHSAD